MFCPNRARSTPRVDPAKYVLSCENPAAHLESLWHCDRQDRLPYLPGRWAEACERPPVGLQAVRSIKARGQADDQCFLEWTSCHSALQSGTGLEWLQCVLPTVPVFLAGVRARSRTSMWEGPLGRLVQTIACCASWLLGSLSVRSWLAAFLATCSSSCLETMPCLLRRHHIVQRPNQNLRMGS
jgi:hypothetical protein